MPSNKCRGNDKIRKLSFGKPQLQLIQARNSKDAKTGGWNLDDKQDFCLIVKYLPTKLLLITKRKIVTL